MSCRGPTSPTTCGCSERGAGAAGRVRRPALFGRLLAPRPVPIRPEVLRLMIEPGPVREAVRNWPVVGTGAAGLRWLGGGGRGARPRHRRPGARPARALRGSLAVVPGRPASCGWAWCWVSSFAWTGTASASSSSVDDRHADRHHHPGAMGRGIPSRFGHRCRLAAAPGDGFDLIDGPRKRPWRGSRSRPALMPRIWCPVS